jgi:hypothetical protein
MRCEDGGVLVDGPAPSLQQRDVDLDDVDPPPHGGCGGGGGAVERPVEGGKEREGGAEEGGRRGVIRGSFAFHGSG